MSTKTRHSSMRNLLMILAAMVVLFISADLIYKWHMTGTLTGHGFSEREIHNIKNDIKAKYEGKNGLSVEKVALIKTSASTLEGFIEMRTPNNERIQKPCEARKGENLRIIWKCVGK